jgi:hypothetical protein
MGSNNSQMSGKSNAHGLFSNPELLRFSDEQMAKVRESQQRLEEARKTGRMQKTKGGQSKLKFYQFPKEAVWVIIRVGRGGIAAMGVLAVLCEIWFRNNPKCNPIRLTSCSLESYGISRWQKSLGLEILKKAGHITVRKERGKNPLVTLNWLPLGGE